MKQSMIIPILLSFLVGFIIYLVMFACIGQNMQYWDNPTKIFFMVVTVAIDLLILERFAKRV